MVKLKIIVIIIINNFFKKYYYYYWRKTKFFLKIKKYKNLDRQVIFISH